MKKTDNLESKDLSLVFAKSQLICAQSLEIMLEGWLNQFASSSQAGEFCEILEETANIYLNISERISALRANDAIFVPIYSDNLAENTDMPKKITL